VTERASQPGGIAIREADASDAEAIAAVHVDSWRAAYVGLVPQRVLDGLSVERRRDFWARRLEDPGENRTFVAELGGRIVGFAGTTLPTDPEYPPGTAELATIYLQSAAWGRGIGGRLMGRAMDDLAERGFSAVVLWVLAGNARGRGFYEALGWCSDGRAQMLDFDGTPVEEVRYRLDLPARSVATD
jgi:ribosomal protein S18 acetylase RimI-like enzyme